MLLNFFLIVRQFQPGVTDGSIAEKNILYLLLYKLHDCTFKFLWSFSLVILIERILKKNRLCYDKLYLIFQLVVQHIWYWFGFIWFFFGGYDVIKVAFNIILKYVEDHPTERILKDKTIPL